MTITITADSITFPGTGSPQTFTYPFPIPGATSTDQTNVQVIYTDAVGNQTVIPNTQYSITGINNANGGVVTYPLVGSPIAVGTSLTIARVVPYQQTVSLQNQGSFLPKSVELADDLQEMQIQQLKNALGRAVQAPIVDGVINMTLPAKAARAGKGLGFDSNGLPALVSLSGGSIPSIPSSVGPYYNVVDFGAKGDGSTDDAAAFQAAVTAATASPSIKTVYVPNPSAGYVLGSTISIPDGINIRGDNYWNLGLSLVKPKAGFTAPLFQTTGYGVTRVLRIGLEGITIDGSSTTLIAVQAACQESVFSHLCIRNCFTYGVQLAGVGSGANQQALNNTFDHCYFVGQVGIVEFFDALFIDNHSADTKVSNCYFEAAKDALIRSRGYNDQISDCHLFASSASGGGGGYGYYTETSADKLFIGNYVENTNNAGVFIDGGASDVTTLNAVIANNTFRNIDKGNVSSGVIVVQNTNVSSITITANAVRRDAATSFSTPYFAFFNAITPTLSYIWANVWESGLITTAETNIGGILTIRDHMTVPVNVYLPSGETTFKAGVVIQGSDPGSHTGFANALTHIEHRPIGSGTNGPTNADFGLQVSILKQGLASGTSAPTGEIDAINVAVRQAGTDSDAGGILVNTLHSGTGFCATLESVTSIAPAPTFAVTQAVRTQIGVVNNKASPSSFGFFASADVGTIGEAFRASGNGGTFTYLFRGQLNNVDAFTVDGNGNATIFQNISSTTQPALNVQQSGTGDAIIQWLLTATRAWVAGIDNSDGDAWKLGPANDGFATAVLRVNTTGQVLALSPTGGLGYGQGAGGAVTQLTDKTTAVTLNTITGQITTAASALGSGVASIFTLNNSTIAATDCIHSWIVSSPTADAYIMNSATAVSAGSCRLRIANITGGSLSQAVVIGFIVIKAVNS